MMLGQYGSSVLDRERASTRRIMVFNPTRYISSPSFSSSFNQVTTTKLENGVLQVDIGIPIQNIRLKLPFPNYFLDNYLRITFVCRIICMKHFRFLLIFLYQNISRSAANLLLQRKKQF